MEKYKREFKQKLQNQKGISLSNKNIIVTIFVFSLLFFVGVQLYTNAKLSPLGHQLASLNTEKNLLIEDNRELEQKIAKNRSLTVINKYSAEKLDLTKTDKTNLVNIVGWEITASRY